MNTHPTAVIHKATRISEEVSIGAYAVIEDGVELGSGSVVREHAVLRSGTVLGRNCHVDAHVVLGGLPQDLGFNPKTPTGIQVGDGVTFREGVTINRSTKEGCFTVIGDHAFLMANSHVGHDCHVGAHAILANGVLLAGHVSVGQHTFIGGNAAVHQFCRIGETAMVGGLARVSQDVPSFCLMAERNDLIGLNLVGLKRRGCDRDVIRELKHLYQVIFDVEGRPRALAEAALADGLAKSKEGTLFLEFLSGESRKGVIRPRGGRA